MSRATLVEALLDALPQTQCTRCGYADCRSYAEGIVGDGADINRCPPGGQEGVERLARLAGRPVLALDPACGREGPRARAVVDEAWCIGCALCLKACPVDAIVGAAKRMHTVIDDLCTGCELCIPACPVDCISLVAVTGAHTGWDAWSPAQADEARALRAARRARRRDVIGGRRGHSGHCAVAIHRRAPSKRDHRRGPGRRPRAHHAPALRSAARQESPR